MAWLEDYDPTPVTSYDIKMDFGPPSLGRALALLGLFLFFATAVWWMATALHTSLPKEQQTIMVRAIPYEREKFTDVTVASEGAFDASEEDDEAVSSEDVPDSATSVETGPSEKAAKLKDKVPSTEAERHFFKAEELYDGKKYKAAAKELRKGLSLEPENAAQRAMLAMVLSYQGAWDESVEEYNKVLEEHSDDALIHLGLAVALYRQERIEDAVASLKRAMKIEPDLEEAKQLHELLTRAPEGTLDKVWLEHNVSVKEWEGFWIHTSCTANFWGGRKGILKASFFFEDGREVPGSFSNLVLSNGQAAIEGPFKPPHRKTHYKDLHLFFPYKGMRLGEGEHFIDIQVDLVGPVGRVLATRWGSLRLEVLKTAFGGAVEQARSSNPPAATSTQ
jgi:tetratricopeptide (TPR) repeat protein